MQTEIEFSDKLAEILAGSELNVKELMRGEFCWVRYKNKLIHGKISEHFYMNNVVICASDNTLIYKPSQLYSEGSVKEALLSIENTKKDNFNTNLQKSKKSMQTKIKLNNELIKMLSGQELSKHDVKTGEMCWIVCAGDLIFGEITHKCDDGYIEIVADCGGVHYTSNCYYSEFTVLRILYSMNSDKTNTEYDTVTKPKHYMLFPDKGIEVRNLVEMLLNRASENGYNKPMFLSDYAQMLQYILRYDAKNGKEDLEKAKWYLDKMIESL